MRRTVLAFSVRADVVQHPTILVPRIEQALGCTFASAWIHGEYVRRGYVLGMSLLLSEWQGIGGAPTYQLHGFADGHTPETADFVDISSTVIGLLAEHGAGAWRVPSQEEIDAEIAAATEPR